MIDEEFLAIVDEGRERVRWSMVIFEFVPYLSICVTKQRSKKECPGLGMDFKFFSSG